MVCALFFRHNVSAYLVDYSINIAFITSWQIQGENVEVVADHGIQSHHFMANRWGKKNGNSDKLYFLGLQNHCGQQLQP